MLVGSAHLTGRPPPQVLDRAAKKAHAGLPTGTRAIEDRGVWDDAVKDWETGLKIYPGSLASV